MMGESDGRFQKAAALNAMTDLGIRIGMRRDLAPRPRVRFAKMVSRLRPIA